MKEIGAGYTGFEFAHSVRVDKDDNIWTVDEGTNMVTKFSPDGRILMVLGHRPLAVLGALPAPPGPNVPAEKYTFCRPTDCRLGCPQGNIFVSDGYCNNRVVKYSKEGRFIAQAGSEKAGNAPGEFNLPHGLQVDGQGHEFWVADRSNFRYQVLDNDLKPIRQINDLGVGWTAHAFHRGRISTRSCRTRTRMETSREAGRSPARSTRPNSTARFLASSDTPANSRPGSRWFT